MGCVLLRDRAETCRRTFIGAESNVAIALSSLGHRTQWVSRLGTDEIGDHIVERLRDRGVDLHVARDADRQTGFAIKELRPERTLVRYYRKGSAASALSMADVPPLRGARWLHLTGITPALSRSCARLVPELVDEAARQGVQVSLDVNLRPVLWESLTAAADTIGHLCRAADLIFIGDDESRTLRLGDTGEEFRKHVQPRPEAIVVFKRGPHGAEVSVAGATYTGAATPTRVVDVTGAGDAFAAGFLSGLLRELPIPQCLRLGSVIASQVISIDRDYIDPLHQEAVDAMLRSVTDVPHEPAREPR